MSDSIRDILKLLPGGTYTIHGLSLSGGGVDGLSQGDVLIDLTTPTEVDLKIRFRGVRNLQFRSGPYSSIQIAGLIIDDVSRDQWPGVRYRVSSENDEAQVAFLCAAIEIDDSAAPGTS